MSTTSVSNGGNADKTPLISVEHVSVDVDGEQHVVPLRQKKKKSGGKLNTSENNNEEVTTPKASVAQRYRALVTDLAFLVSKLFYSI